MNLNAYARHGVFEDGATDGLVSDLAARLRDGETIRRARVFPFQLLATWRALDQQVPVELREALQDAMEIALENVPVLAGKVYVLPDASGSMGAPVTGARQGASSQVTCRDAAALIASAILRRNPSAQVIAFDDQVRPLGLNPRDTVTTNAEVLARTGGGGVELLRLKLYIISENEQKSLQSTDRRSGRSSWSFASYRSPLGDQR